MPRQALPPEITAKLFDLVDDEAAAIGQRIARVQAILAGAPLTPQETAVLAIFDEEGE